MGLPGSASNGRRANLELHQNTSCLRDLCMLATRLRERPIKGIGRRNQQTPEEEFTTRTSKHASSVVRPLRAGDKTPRTAMVIVTKKAEGTGRCDEPSQEEVESPRISEHPISSSTSGEKPLCTPARDRSLLVGRAQVDPDGASQSLHVEDAVLLRSTNAQKM